MNRASFNMMSAALITLMTFMNVSSCRPAGYEVIKGGQDGRDKDSGNPNTISPDTGRPTAPMPLGSNVPPTARVETIWNGQSVVKVRVNTAVSIRPTWDTVDPDDVGRSACINPGIVRAEYDIEGTARDAQRVAGCESLAIPYTFTQPGEYEIAMVVTSNEDEKAWASMILTVVDTNAPLTDGIGGFTISAKPMVAGIGQSVAFTGVCYTPTKNTIRWDFADGASATGVTVGHPYRGKGQYRVTAVCTDLAGNDLHATVTIVVVDKPFVIPGDPGKPDLPPVDPTDPGHPGQNPGQNPGQGPTQGPGQGPRQY